MSYTTHQIDGLYHFTHKNGFLTGWWCRWHCYTNISYFNNYLLKSGSLYWVIRIHHKPWPNFLTTCPGRPASCQAWPSPFDIRWSQAERRAAWMTPEPPVSSTAGWEIPWFNGGFWLGKSSIFMVDFPWFSMLPEGKPAMTGSENHIICLKMMIRGMVYCCFTQTDLTCGDDVKGDLTRKKNREISGPNLLDQKRQVVQEERRFSVTKIVIFWNYRTG